MGHLARSVSGNGHASHPNPRWEDTPIFARTFFEGCFEADEESSPRLKVTDLQHPESFHLRLAAFLMKQH